jgi:alpha-1,3-rhamnosyl/mannosyltransferase
LTITTNGHLVFDGRTLGDHYPGIGRYAFGLRQALGSRVGLTWIDPALNNSRFAITGPTQASPSVRSLTAQWSLPHRLSSSDRYYSPYWLMPYRLPCLSIVTLYDATPLFGSEMSALNKIIFRLCHWLAGRVARRVIVLSESAKVEMAALGVPAGKICVCPPGLESKFQPASLAEKKRIKQKYDLPDQFWLCFGSKRWHKNTKAAIEAAGSRPLIVVGQSATLPHVPEEDLPALYSTAHCLVFPSLREGFGLPIIEAMACGTPVVCLPAPGVREAAGDAAVLAADLTASALAESLSQLDSESIWQAKREAGLQWATRFTWTRTIAAILDDEDSAHL